MKKPVVKLIGADSNIFNLMSLARRAMINAGLKEESKQMIDEVTKSGHYHEAISIIMKYCEVK
jgi:hypothetical protein